MKKTENIQKIISKIAEQPNQTWTLTQRELGSQIGIAPSELSVLIKQLRSEGRISQGERLPYRGSTYALRLDSTTPTQPKTPSRDCGKVFDLTSLSFDDLHSATAALLKAAAAQESEFKNKLKERDARIKDYRDLITADHKHKEKLLNAKEESDRKIHVLERELRIKDRGVSELQQQIETLESLKDELAELRGKYNDLMLAASTSLRESHEKPQRTRGFTVSEMIDDEENNRLLEFLRGS